MSWRTGAPIHSVAIHLKYGVGCWSLTMKVSAEGALRPRPATNAGILAASVLGSRLV